VPQDTESREQSRESRTKRERLLAALLETFPTAPLHPYAESSSRYQKLYKGRTEAAVRGMMVSRLAIVMRRWRKYLDEQLRREGQNLNRWQTLFELAVNEDGETLTSIAMRVGVVGPRLVGILEELERDGLIERTVDAQDRRSKLIVLTPAGEQVVFAMFEKELNLRKDFFAGIGESQMLLMLDAIGVMTENLDNILVRDGQAKTCAPIERG
jgi:MarR family transcriptional regulator for hemolysin